MQNKYSRDDYRSRNGTIPLILVIHDTECSSFKVDLSILQAIKHNPEARAVSVHYLISPEGELAGTQQGLVDVQYSAYHAGIASWQGALQQIDENSARKIGFSSWDDYLKNRDKERDIKCDYIHDIVIDRLDYLKISKAEKLQYIDGLGRKHVINYAENIEISNVKNVELHVTYSVEIHKALGITVPNANSLDDISVGIELTNPGDKDFPEPQMEVLSNLCVEILENYKISIFNMVAHADIAPGRKQDPSGYFPWKDLYQKMYDSKIIKSDLLKSELKKMLTILNAACEYPNKVLLERSSKDAPSIEILQNELKEHGYQYVNVSGKFDDNLLDAVNTFNRHFCPEIFIKEKKEGERIIINPDNQRWYKLSQQRGNVHQI